MTTEQTIMTYAIKIKNTKSEEDGEWFNFFKYNNNDEFIKAVLAYFNVENFDSLGCQYFFNIPDVYTSKKDGVNPKIWDILSFEHSYHTTIWAYLTKIDSNEDMNTIAELDIGSYDSYEEFAKDYLDLYYKIPKLLYNKIDFNELAEYFIKTEKLIACKSYGKIFVYRKK